MKVIAMDGMYAKNAGAIFGRNDTQFLSSRAQSRDLCFKKTAEE